LASRWTPRSRSQCLLLLELGYGHRVLRPALGRGDRSIARGVEAAQRSVCGVESTHPVCPGPGRRRRGAQVHAGNARRIRVDGFAWTKDELQRVVAARHDVATDVVR